MKPSIEYKIKKIEQIKEILDLLKEMQISINDLILHPEVIECMESKKYYDLAKYNANQYGLCKNLFIRDKKGKHFWLVIIDYQKEVDLINLKELLNSSRLMLATNDNLKEILKIEPGSVSPFNLINDTKRQVKVLIDERLLGKELLAFHPNYNGATIFIKPEDMLQFLDAYNYDYSFIYTKPKIEIKENLQYVL